MGYATTLEKAGCKILDFKEFGSYQGTWLAFVEYKGEKGIVQGSYGSCGGCDSFMMTFDEFEDPIEKDGKYYKNHWQNDIEDEITKSAYDVKMKAVNDELVEFGKSYLVGGLYNKKYYEDKMADLDKEDWFDEETREECEWAISKFNYK